MFFYHGTEAAEAPMVQLSEWSSCSCLIIFHVERLVEISRWKDATATAFHERQWDWPSLCQSLLTSHPAQTKRLLVKQADQLAPACHCCGNFWKSLKRLHRVVLVKTDVLQQNFGLSPDSSFSELFLRTPFLLLGACVWIWVYTWVYIACTFSTMTDETGSHKCRTARSRYINQVSDCGYSGA